MGKELESEVRTFTEYLLHAPINPLLFMGLARAVDQGINNNDFGLDTPTHPGAKNDLPQPYQNIWNTFQSAVAKAICNQYLKAKSPDLIIDGLKLAQCLSAAQTAYDLSIAPYSLSFHFRGHHAEVFSCPDAIALSQDGDRTRVTTVYRFQSTTTSGSQAQEVNLSIFQDQRARHALVSALGEYLCIPVIVPGSSRLDTQIIAAQKANSTQNQVRSMRNYQIVGIPSIRQTSYQFLKGLALVDA